MSDDSSKKVKKDSWLVNGFKKIKLSLKVIKQKDTLVLSTQLASGVLPNGTKFKVVDAGEFYIVQHKYDKKNTNTWYHYVISKKEIIGELVKKILIDEDVK